ncbi:hypothetical protein [Vibrio phage V-YDF132]|nr:hypothetical protein [Vibrio phage V-YDF132]
MALEITKKIRVRKTDTAETPQAVRSTPPPQKKNAHTVKKYLATVYTTEHHRRIFVRSLGAIFAKSNTDAMHQAEALQQCVGNEYIELSETQDPFEV